MTFVSSCNNNFEQNLPKPLPTSSDKKHKCDKSIQGMPDDLMLNIFSYAHVFPAELGRMALVSKRFKELTSHDRLWNQFTVKTLYPWSYVIDETVWARPELQTEGIDTTGGNVLPIGDKELIKKHVGDLTREAKKTENGELVYMLIPKGSSLNKVRQIAERASMPEGQAGAFVDFVWDEVITDLGDREVEQTHIVAISTSVLEGSRGETFVTQKTRLGNGFEVTQVLEASMLHIIMRIIFSKRLYSNKPALMRSDQQIAGWHLVVEGCSFHGLIVGSSYCCDYEHIGVGALRKF